jgi:hypothetical protein
MSESAQSISGLADLTHPTELIQFGTTSTESFTVISISGFSFGNCHCFVELCPTPKSTAARNLDCRVGS